MQVIRIQVPAVQFHPFCPRDLPVSFRIFFFDFQENVDFELRCFAIFVDVLDDFDGNELAVAATTPSPCHRGSQNYNIWE